jgi:hypothetical protein
MSMSKRLLQRQQLEDAVKDHFPRTFEVVEEELDELFDTALENIDLETLDAVETLIAFLQTRHRELQERWGT